LAVAYFFGPPCIANAWYYRCCCLLRIHISLCTSVFNSFVGI